MVQKAKTESSPPPAAAEPSPESKSASDKTEGKKRFVVQVGAYTEDDKVKETRAKLQKAGLTNYIQVIETKEGKRTTRVRVGPFESKAQAEAAAEKVKELQLPFQVIVL